jgi:response regulator RpfG family c-di-GMP phosphodiesterase
VNAPNAASAPPLHVSVLLVDDQAIIGEAVRRMLASHGDVTYRFVSDPRKAVDEAVAMRPTVILQDLVMPEVDGLDLVDAYRRQGELAEVPIVVLSSKEEAVTKAEAFARGANDYLVKLPDPIELIARLRHHSRGYVAQLERNAAMEEVRGMERSLREKNLQLDEMNRRLSEANEDLADDARAQRERLAALTRLGAQLSDIQDVDVLVERVLDDARRFIDAGAAVLLRKRSGAGGETLAIAEIAREDGVRVDAAGSLPVSVTGLCGRVAITGDTVRVEDAAGLEPAVAAAIVGAGEAGVRSVLIEPLRTAGGATLGVILLADARPGGERPGPGFTEGDERLLRHFASMATVGLERAQLTRSILMRMVGMAELRDPTETGQHVQRVAAYALIVFDAWARRRNLTPDETTRMRDRLRIAAVLHDVGKVGIPDAILKKPGKLEPDERREMERHTEIGAGLFGQFRSDLDAAAAEVALNHHER